VCRVLLFAVLTFASGCAVVHPPVAVVGAAADLAALQGAWEGAYVSPDTRRSGSIFFDLTAGADSAAGEVVMVPADFGQPVRPAIPGQPPTSRPQMEVLTIRFVRAGPGRVSGTLDPYTDPACGCTLVTTFEGTVHGDVIEGTFTSRSLEHRHVQEGTWSVERRPETD
jgi:hypothetical protein